MAIYTHKGIDFDEPCKVLISEVKIIPKENVVFDKKSRLYLIQKSY